MQEDELLTAEECMSYLRISRTTLGRLIASGQINALNIGEGTGLRFKRGDVMAALRPRSAAHGRGAIARGHLPGPDRLPMKFG